MTFVLSKHLRFFPLPEFDASASKENLMRLRDENFTVYSSSSLSEKSVSSEALLLPLTLNSSQNCVKCSSPTFHRSGSTSVNDSPNNGDCRRLSQKSEVPNSVENTPRVRSKSPVRPLKWDHGCDGGVRTVSELVDSQSKNHDANFEIISDFVYTWPPCRSTDVNTNKPPRERQPTPPPQPISLSAPSHVYTPTRKMPAPQFLHSSEMLHHQRNGEGIQINNHSVSPNRVDLSARELHEAVSRAEMWTQRSMRGLREHARSLLLATEAEERRLRVRLASLQSEMMMASETKQSVDYSESSSTVGKTIVERWDGDHRNEEQADEVTTTVDFNTSAAAPQFDRHLHESQYATDGRFFAKGDLILSSDATPDLGEVKDVALKDLIAVNEGDPNSDDLPPSSCQSTSQPNEGSPNPICHSTFQHWSKREIQEQRHHRSQSDNPDEATGNAESVEHFLIGDRTQEGISIEKQVTASTTHDGKRVSEHLDSSKVDNFCQAKVKLNEEDRHPTDEFHRINEDRGIQLTSIPPAGEVISKTPSNLLTRANTNSVSSLTEVSLPLEAVSSKSADLPVGAAAAKLRLIQLFKEESKQLKAAKAAYLSKKQAIRTLKALLNQDMWPPKSEATVPNMERNPSPVNTITDITMSKSESRVNTSCRSGSNSVPLTKSSSPSPCPPRPKMSPCCKIVISTRGPKTQVWEPVKSAKKRKQPNVEKMYAEFIKSFEPPRLQRRNSTASEEERNKSPLSDPFRRAFDRRDVSKKADVERCRSPQHSSPEKTKTCASRTVCQCHSCRPHCPTTSANPDFHCCIHACCFKPTYPPHESRTSCPCSPQSDNILHDTERPSPSSHSSRCRQRHHEAHQKGKHKHHPTCSVCLSHTAVCQGKIVRHCNSRYFTIHKDHGSDTNRSHSHQPCSLSESPSRSSGPNLPLQPSVQETAGVDSTEQKATCALSQCFCSRNGEGNPPVLSTHSPNATDLTYTINNRVARTGRDGCAWFEPFPRCRPNKARSYNRRRLSEEEMRISQCTHWRPAFRDYSQDPGVKFNYAHTDPPYACDREEDFNQYNGSNTEPLSLQEAFRLRMQVFIARCEARQRYIKLNALERRLQAEYSGMRLANNSNIVFHGGNVGPKTRVSSLSLPDYLNCPRLLCAFGQTICDRAVEKKQKKLSRKLLAPREAHRLILAEKKNALLTNRARMKRYSEEIRQKLLKSHHNT